MISRIETVGNAMRSGPTMTPVPPQTRGITVLGWLLVCFSVIPLAMGATGDGRWIGFGGAAMLTAGVAMVMIGRWPQRDKPR